MDPENESEKHLRNLIKGKTNVLFLCENPQLLEDALDLIPIEQLQVDATLKVSTLEDLGFEDALLLELLKWFKCSFFSWVDTPRCATCGQIAVSKRDVPPNEAEKAWLAQTVEQYYCIMCQAHVRFPRYNHPRKLLETRCGRCGEWAMCFYLFCRALGYDARWVFDMRDHVWTEVYSACEARWLHCDPCENACDTPLMYEAGWKKPVTYVLAISREEIQDVTWRYSAHFSEAMERRREEWDYGEAWLVNFLLAFTAALQSNAPAERRRQLAKRRALELAGFLTEPKVCDDSYCGRTSGSLSWRVARGEILPHQKAFVFELTEKECVSKNLHVKYSSAADKYVRVSDQSAESESWSACTYKRDNIFRNLEADWKMVYLARTEKSDKAVIAWKFDFDDSGLIIQTLKVHLKCNTWESGIIKWYFASEGGGSNVSKMYEANDVSNLLTHDFEGCRNLTISAELTHGSGAAAWQHTQLFRQEIDSNEYPFDVEIRLK